jgi:hypothetical protein
VALAAARQRADDYQRLVNAIESLLEESTEKLRAALDANDEFARENRRLREEQENWAKIIHREAGWKRRYEEMRAERDAAVRKAEILTTFSGMSFREQLEEMMDPGVIEHVNRLLGREAPDAEAS